MADASQVLASVTNPTGSNTSLALANIDLGPSEVKRILLTFPAGCGGLVGVRIEAAGGYAFPNQPGQFLSFDDYTYAFDVTNQAQTGRWTKVAYNVDLIPHLVTVVFEYDYLRGIQSVSQSLAVAL